jgi:hypothetical protein
MAAFLFAGFRLPVSVCDGDIAATNELAGNDGRFAI